MTRRVWLSLVSSLLGFLTVLIADRAAIAQPAPAVVHVIGPTRGPNGDTIGHATFTFGPGGGWSGVGDVEAQAGNIGHVQFLDSVVIGRDLHALALASDGNLYHTIRHDDGSWVPFGNLTAVLPPPPGMTGFNGFGLAASHSGELHVCMLLVTEPGPSSTIWHTIRHADGSWSGWGNVSVAANYNYSTIAGPIHCAGTTTSSDEVHVTVASALTFQQSQHMFNAVRHPDGSWEPFVDVTEQLGGPFTTDGGFDWLATTTIGDTLYAASLDLDDDRFASRASDGTWTPFDCINCHVGNLSEDQQMSVTSVGGMLVFGIATDDGEVHLAIRNSDGTWQHGWDSLSQLTGGRIDGGVSLAAAQGEL